jgi:hypothetical protein
MPAFEIDRGAKDAPLQLFAIMCWPHDVMARQSFLATAAAQAMQHAEDLLPRVAEEVSEFLIRQVQAVGLPIDPAVIKAQALKLGAAAVSNVLAEISNDLFRPSGGFGRVAAASGVDAITKSAMDNGGRFGHACGEILSYIVRLRKHHPDVEPSINRATYILVRTARKEGRNIPPERLRATMWTKWGGVAPLWGAYALCTWAALARGIDSIFFDDIISGSLWLAEFAVGFKPKGSRDVLLPETKVIRIRCQLEAVEPEISPLTHEQVAWAKAYKVRP